MRVLAENGAWTWFNDERAVFVGPYLYIGYVDTAGYSSMTAYPLEAGVDSSRWKLSSFQQVDDHNNPALLHLNDGRTLAAYAHHGSEPYWNWRFEDEDPERIAWSSEHRAEPLPRGVTYNNLFQLNREDGRIYNFFRGINYNPTVMASDDGGRTWSDPRHIIRSGEGGTRPYVKYVSDGEARIDLLYTQGHPRREKNDVYHLYYQNSALYESDGTLICRVAESECLPVPFDAGTRIYDAGEAGRAWVWDIEYADGGLPVAAYITARDSTVGNDLRYRYARWESDEGAWSEQEIAHAGTHLYDGENHYAGGISIDPNHPSTVYLSADVHPETGNATATGRYQMWRGTTADGGAAWIWERLTDSQSADNLRPFVPRGGGDHHAVLWLRGRYTTYTDFDTDVVGLVRSE